MEISKRYNSVPVKDNCVLFAPAPYFQAGLCNGVMKISPLKTPVVMATNRFYSKTKLAAASQERQTLKRSCYRLHSVATGQIPHFTERISTYNNANKFTNGHNTIYYWTAH